jgi:hypothetical protein
VIKSDVQNVVNIILEIFEYEKKKICFLCFLQYAALAAGAYTTQAGTASNGLEPSQQSAGNFLQLLSLFDS